MSKFWRTDGNECMEGQIDKQTGPLYPVYLSVCLSKAGYLLFCFLTIVLINLYQVPGVKGARASFYW